MSDDGKRIRLLEAAAALLDATTNRRLKIVSLNKALFYFDLASLRDYGETFTRNSYIALPMGPVVANYPKRLIKPLENSGIAKQAEEGDAKPVYLMEAPKFTLMTPEHREKAGRVARWCDDQTSAQVSEFSHKNLGWFIARRTALESGQPARAIDMHIAMQQIVDSDPWMTEPLTDAEREACEVADGRGGFDW